MTQYKKVLIVAGGTGGHIFPALAIAQELKQQNVTVEWLGTANRMEANLVPKYGFKIHFIKITGIVSKGLLVKLMSPFKVFTATMQAIKICKDYKPDAIICMGGYVCGPAGLAAKALGIPLILHEQNCVFGLTNKLLKKISTRTLSAFNLPQQKAEDVVGQPLRKVFLENSVEQNLHPLLEKVKQEYNLLIDFIQQLHLEEVNPTILDLIASKTFSEANYQELINLLNVQQKAEFIKLIFNQLPPKLVSIGGSLGAKVLNDTLAPTIKHLQDLGYNFTVLQQVGKGNAPTVEKLVSDLNLTNFTVSEFIDNMQKTYYDHDIIVCRSGALTVFEVAQSNRFAIFIPYPGQKDQQQLKNTQDLQQLNACSVIKQPNLTVDSLSKVLISNSYFDLYQKAKNQVEFATPQATNKIVNIIEQIINK